MKTFTCDITREENGVAYAGEIIEVSSERKNETLVVLYMDNNGVRCHSQGSKKDLLVVVQRFIERLEREG